MIKNILFELKLKNGAIYDYYMTMITVNDIFRSNINNFEKVHIPDKSNYCDCITVIKKFICAAKSYYGVYWETIRNKNLIKTERLCL